MDVVAWIFGIALVLVLMMAGSGKVMSQAMSLEIRDRLAVDANLWKGIGVLEILGAIGAVVGLLSNGDDLEWAGLVAGVGVVLLMIGALIHHQRAGDKVKDMIPAVVLLVLAIIYLVALGAR